MVIHIVFNDGSFVEKEVSFDEMIKLGIGLVNNPEFNSIRVVATDEAPL